MVWSGGARARRARSRKLGQRGGQPLVLGREVAHALVRGGRGGRAHRHGGGQLDVATPRRAPGGRSSPARQRGGYRVRGADHSGRDQAGTGAPRSGQARAGCSAWRRRPRLGGWTRARPGRRRAAASPTDRPPRARTPRCAARRTGRSCARDCMRVKGPGRMSGAPIDSRCARVKLLVTAALDTSARSSRASCSEPADDVVVLDSLKRGHRAAWPPRPVSCTPTCGRRGGQRHRVAGV